MEQKASAQLYNDAYMSLLGSAGDLLCLRDAPRGQTSGQEHVP
jgi:hypothetical protein